MASGAVRVSVGGVIGAAFSLAGLALDVLRGGDGLTGVLLFVGVIVGGAYARRASWGAGAGLLAFLIMLITWIALNPGLARALSDPNVLAALVLLNVLIVAALAAAAGFIAGRIAGRRKGPIPA